MASDEAPKGVSSIPEPNQSPKPQSLASNNQGAQKPDFDTTKKNPAPSGIYWPETAPLAAFPGRVISIDLWNQGPRAWRSSINQHKSPTNLAESLEKNKVQTEEGPHFLRIFHVQNARWAEEVLCRRYRLQCCEGPAEGPCQEPRVDASIGAYWDAVDRLNSNGEINDNGFQTTCHAFRSMPRSEKARRSTYSGLNLHNITCGLSRTLSSKIGYGGFHKNGPRVTELSRRDQLVSAFVYYPGAENFVPEDDNPDPHDLLPTDRHPTIVIFDNCRQFSPNPSPSQIEDDLKNCFIQPRGDMELGWRRRVWSRMPFKAVKEELDPDTLTLHSIDIVIADLLDLFIREWDTRLQNCSWVVETLQNQVYENPVDDSRAPELWKCNAEWMRLRQLANVHMREVKSFLRFLVESLGDEHKFDAIDRSVRDFELLQQRVENELIEPTIAMSNTIYQAVSFRDTKISLQLNTSLWRLSWITFVFLPLSFVCGFFGMNVDTFNNNPPVKWYFISAVPLMATIVLASFIAKHVPGSEHPTPYELTKYERVFRRLAVSQPAAFTTDGPRLDFAPTRFVDRIRFRLLRNWFHPSKLVQKTQSSEKIGEAYLGPWTKFKCFLLEYWAARIQILDETDVSLKGVPKDGSGSA